MSPLPSTPYVEIHVPHAMTEQEFLRLAVQVASRNYRQRHAQLSAPQAISQEARALQENAT